MIARLLSRACLLILLAATPALAQDALVLTLNGFSDDTELATEEIAATLAAMGYGVEVREPTAGDPLFDIDTFNCVFDIRPEMAFLPPDWYETEAFLATLIAGRGLFFIGEHQEFQQRNDAIAEVLEILGAGPLAFDPTPVGFPAIPHDYPQPMNPMHELASECEPVSELVYDGVDHGRFTDTGTGTWVTGAPDLAGTAGWDRGQIPFAPDARALVILDVNAMSPVSTLDYLVEAPPGTVPTENRAFLANAIGWLCGSPGAPTASPCVLRCEPRTHGFWHRYCLGQDAIDPGRFGRGNGPRPSPQHLDIPANTITKADTAMVPHLISACDALDIGPFSDERQAALRELATLHLNISAELLSTGCPVELHPVIRGDDDLTVLDAIRFMEERLALGTRRALREARWIGEHVNNAEALLPLDE